ncbi:MAG: recombinase family protein [Lachnospiraceae bacterium]|nr:recombinase family protein [Lachnospiraceae bacterium]
MRKISKIEPKLPIIQARKKVAAYARVSRDTERLMHSVSAQVSYYSALIQKNPEWEYAGVYADMGISGTDTSKRGEFLRMLADCEEGKIDIILTKSISRFARNTVDLLETVRHLKDLGIEVRFEKEHIHSLSEDGELMLTLLASFAQEESRSISENVKWGVRKRFQSGEIGAANKHILGYRYDDGLRKYVIIPEEAEAVRWMFQMYIDGVPLRGIAESMNSAGIRTTLGNDFQEASVRQLIFNEVYAGDIRRQKCYMADPITKTKVKNCGELPQYYMADCHEAIIDRETYAKVQAEMERRAGLVNPTYPFTGKIKCGICGQSFTRRKGITKGKEYVSWFCRAKKEVGMTCTSCNYSEQNLMEICAKLMGTDSFNGTAFESSVRLISALPDGSLEVQFFDGQIKRWEMPPKPAKVLDKPVKKRPAHLFDGKIFCGQCGRRYGRAVSESKDRHLYWYCRAKSHHGVTCDSVNYPDSEMKEIFCMVMGLEAFDEGFFTETVERMVVQKTGSIDFHLKDGTVKTYETLKLRSNRHENTSTDEFTGKIRCASCGNLYHRYCCYGKYTYWRCSGKSKVRTECSGRDFQDSDIRKVSAYMMGMEEFDAEAFNGTVDYITAFPDSSLEIHFYDGRAERWQR